MTMTAWNGLLKLTELGVNMTEIQEQIPPKPTIIIPNNCLWVCLYWIEGVSWPQSMFGQDKADVIKWALQNSSCDKTKPLKLYRLDY